MFAHSTLKEGKKFKKLKQKYSSLDNDWRFLLLFYFSASMIHRKLKDDSKSNPHFTKVLGQFVLKNTKADSITLSVSVYVLEMLWLQVTVWSITF